MSIFKVKEWWSNENLLGENNGEDLRYINCLKVERFKCYDSDCIIVSQGNVIKIYKPNLEENSSQIILETLISDVSLQITTGKFTMDADDRQIIILHSKSFLIYCLDRKEGHIDLGDQNALRIVVKHSFNRKACNMVCGPFGYSKSRDFICIQALDGTLSFFDQDTFLFMCVYNDVIIPGPICYVSNNDLFIICRPTWILETYSYQQLGEFSELSVKSSKKNIPQWTYNPGEEIFSLQSIRTSTNFCSIVALGERHIYCFQDNGLMKFMIRLDYVPICFHAYLIGWYYEPNSRLILMVGSEDSKLYIYEGSTLLWSCDLLNKAISISRCFLNSLSGGLVALSMNGVVNIGYLGTEPNLNSNATQMHEIIDPVQIQAELEVVEKSLGMIMGDKDDTYNHVARNEKLLQIRADIGQLINNAQNNFANDDEMLRTCSIVIKLTCAEPNMIQSVQITHNSYPPIVCTESTICLDSVNGTEIIETGVYLFGEDDIYNAHVDILFTIIDCSGKICILSKKIFLPINLYCFPLDLVQQNKVTLSVKCNQPCINWLDIFTDFMKEEITNNSSSNAITFAYRMTNRTVSINASDHLYIFGADDFCDVHPVLMYFLNNLKKHFDRNGVSHYRIEIESNADLNKHISQKFLKCIEQHAKQRVLMNNLQNELNVLHRQFTVVQKRLLVQYGSVPPGDCEPLEFLMKDTHERIINTTKNLIQSKQRVCSAGNNLSAVGHLLIFILQEIAPNDVKVKLLEEMLCLDSLSEQSQEWEEGVFQATSYFIKTILKNSVKDKEKLARVTDQDILSQNNLKKFLRQIRLILERTFNDNSVDTNNDAVEKITRIEELVEVI